MRLYHYTTPLHLERIASDLFLKVTESNIGGPRDKGIEPCGEHVGPDVVWLTDHDGTKTNRDTLRAGCVLSSGPLSVIAVDKTVVRFTVDVPDEEVTRWSDFADEHGMHKRWRKIIEKWPAKPNWWYVVERPIGLDEWVEVCPTFGEPVDFPAALNPVVNLVSATDRAE